MKFYLKTFFSFTEKYFRNLPKIKTMKKLVMITIPAILLSACSYNQVFLKRKYTKGIFIESIIAKKNIDSEKLSSSKFLSDTKHATGTSLIASNSNVAITLNSKNTVAEHPSYIEAKVNKINKNKRTTFSLNYKNNQPLTKTNYSISDAYSDFTNLLNISAFHTIKKSTASDDDKIIWIILSLFPVLALIAIYLHDGKKITANFWIDLILHFIFLYWLFALLVVLDVINLA